MNQNKTLKQTFTQIFSSTFLVVTLLILASCGGEEEAASVAQKEDSIVIPPYKIEKSSCMQPYKCSYDLRLQDKYSEEELSAIAVDLKKKSPKVDRIFIVHYLPCMEVDNGGWATTHFSPDLSVNVQDYMLTSNPTCPEAK
ncbi:MAG: hypothetical protein ACTSXQ_06145 [Alphaproteobacteria bacterium]